jgi:hypothetical protein
VVKLVLKNTDVLGVNSTIVIILEVLGYMNTARDGSVSVKLGLHLVNTLDFVVFTNVVLNVCDGRAVFKSGVTLSWRGSGAVTAHVNWFAEAALEIIGDVLHAWWVVETILIGIGIDISWVSAVAGASSLAVDDYLGVKADRGWGLEVIKDVEAISNRWGSALSPAGSTVLGNVLVLVPGQIVLAVHVSPVNNCRNRVVAMNLPRVGSGFYWTVLEGSLLNSACSSSWGIEEFVIWDYRNLILASSGIEGRLGEGVDSLVIVFIILLFDGGLMPFLVSPGVLWRAPRAITFNVKVVNTSAKTEESLLTPVGSPWVSHSPEGLAVFDTITNNGNVVHGLQVSSGITENTAGVIFESLSYRNTTSDGTTLVDFLHHVCFGWDTTILLYFVDSILGWNNASIAWAAVSTELHRWADNSIVVSTSLVDRAGSISGVALMHESEDVERPATVTAVVEFLAWDKDLWRDVDIGPGSFSGDLDTIGDSWGTGMSPARAAVLGNVLVEDVGQIVGAVNVIPDPLFW